MIYWCTRVTAISRNIIFITTLLFTIGILFTNHSYFVKAGLIVSSLYFYFRFIQYRTTLPVALIYQQQRWSCIYKDRINNIQFTSGFATWPICIIEYSSEDTPDIKERLCLSYWDVSQRKLAGNWNQLAVVLKVAKRQNTPDKDILSLIS